MIRHINTIVVILVLLFAADVSVAVAKDSYETEFVKEMTNHGNLMVLKGTALKRAFFMKAFVAGFYLQENVPTEDVFDEVSKRIEVNYFVNISGEKLSDYTEKLMQKNTTKMEFESIQERVELMRDYFVDLNPGDQFALTYVPDKGTQFEYNGKVVGIIEGRDFAKGIFSTWIGEKPMDDNVKSKILGLSDDKI